MDVVLPYVRERKQFGQPLGHFQLFLRGLNGDALIVSRRHVAGVRKMMQQLQRLAALEPLRPSSLVGRCTPPHRPTTRARRTCEPDGTLTTSIDE